jgi:hypothetical protein
MTWEQFKRSKCVAKVAARPLATKTGRDDWSFVWLAKTDARRALGHRESRPP